MDRGRTSSESQSPESHWSEQYRDRDPDELPWHQPIPSTLGLVTAHAGPSDPVIDVGGGTSRLASELVALGYRDVTVLDLTTTALDGARDRLGDAAGRVRFVHADVTRFEPDRRWALWHDRAVFHFLTDPAERAAYRSVAARALGDGGTLVVATFGPGGPEWCAGLPVCRYDGPSLAAEFVPGFEVVETRGLEPASTTGDQRPYVVAVLRRISD